MFLGKENTPYNTMMTDVRLYTLIQTHRLHEPAAGADVGRGLGAGRCVNAGSSVVARAPRGGGRGTGEIT